MRDEHWRFIRYADVSEELYDHRRDPHEWKNLAADHAFALVRDRLAKSLPAPKTKAAPHEK